MDWRIPATCLCIAIAGALMATIPDESVPSIAWRFHFGFANWFFGAVAGMGIGGILAKLATN
jgi:hypothetical protein